MSLWCEEHIRGLLKVTTFANHAYPYVNKAALPVLVVVSPRDAEGGYGMRVIQGAEPCRLSSSVQRSFIAFFKLTRAADF